MSAMFVEELWHYPVKSMAGERLASATLGPAGIARDRGFLVRDKSGRIQTARTHPGLLLMQAAFGPDGVLRVDGARWDDAGVADRVRAAAGPEAYITPGTSGGHFDILPLLVVTDGAMAALGTDRRRLRPNVVIGGVEGLAERSWEGHFLAAGTAVIGLADLRERCIMTTFDPDTAEQDVEVLKRIHREFGGKFALNAWTARPGTIAAGDEVRLLEAFDGVEPPRWGRFAG